MIYDSVWLHSRAGGCRRFPHFQEICRGEKRKYSSEKEDAHTVIRTQDLVITSDALYQLSHASYC